MLAAYLAAVAVAVAAFVAFHGKHTTTVSADFASSVGVYPGSDVRLRGVAIGRVVSVTPQAGSVHIVMEYDSRFSLPATVGAVIISPSVVADRFVQFTDAHSGTGPTLTSGATIPLARTRVPIELDQIYGTAKNLLDALGPNGANRDGAVNRFLHSTATGLQGNGGALHSMLANLGGASSALGAGSDDLYASLSSLAQLTAAFAADDGGVRRFNDEMARTLGFLAGQKDEIGRAVDAFDSSFVTIRDFVHDNQALLKSDIQGLTKVASALVAERAALEEVVRTIPVGLDNLNRTWDGPTQAVRTRSNETEILKRLRGTICDSLITSGAPQPQAICSALSTVLAGMP